MKLNLLSWLTILVLAGGVLHADDKAKAMAVGQQNFAMCMACHGPDGKGMQPIPGTFMAPAYTDSELVKGNPEIMAVLVMKGIQKAPDSKYLGVMAPLEMALNDEALAGVLTYLRNTFGGLDDLVTADQVKEWRAKYQDITAPLSRAQIDEMAKELSAES